jgi:glucokinase
VSDPRVLGIDLGGTKIAVCTFTPDGRRLDRRQFQTLRGPPEGNLARIVELGRELLAGMAPLAIGVSGGGPLDPRRGVIISIPNLPGWEEVPIAERLRDAFGAPVGIENDANACAIAEHRLGAGRGSKDMVFLTLSTGIGGGLILDGKIYRGHRFLAGEAGHQVIVPGGNPCGCGNRGCLEAYASGTAIARMLSERNEGIATAKELVDRARSGDPRARRSLEDIARFLAMGIANLVYILDPERIILGTIAVAAGDLLLAPLRCEVDRLLWPAFRRDLKILPAGLGLELGDYAAFAVAPM